MSLVARYKLDGDVLDSAGSNDGTNYGATFGSGVFDQCANFDGVNDYVQLDTPFAFNVGESLATWIDLSEAAVAADYIFGSSLNHYGIAYTGTKFWIYDGIVGSTDTFTQPTDWIHLTIIRTSVTDYDFYINGSYFDTATTAGNDLDINYFARRDTLTYEAKIKLDDLRIYNHALTEPEIEQLYFNGLPTGTAHPNLLAHYRFENTQANLGIDASGNGNNGTVYGATQGIGQFGGGANVITSQYIDLPLGSLNLYNKGTLSFYYKWNGDATGTLQPIYQRTNGTNGLKIYANNADKILKIYTDSIHTTSYTFSDSIFHHFAIIPSGTTLIIYVDGVYLETIAGVTFYNIPIATVHNIGKDGINYANSSYDEFKGINKACDLIDVNRLRIGQNPR